MSYRTAINRVRLVLCPELVGNKEGLNRIEPNNNDDFNPP